MLTGKRAFKRDSSVENFERHPQGRTAELQEVIPNLTPGLDRVVRHCLEKNPAQRFQSASDVAFDLDTISSQSGTGSRLTAVTDQRRSHWKQAGAVLVAVLALAGTYYAARDNSPRSHPIFTSLRSSAARFTGQSSLRTGRASCTAQRGMAPQTTGLHDRERTALMSRPIDSWTASSKHLL